MAGHVAYVALGGLTVAAASLLVYNVVKRQKPHLVLKHGGRIEKILSQCPTLAAEFAPTPNFSGH